VSNNSTNAFSCAPNALTTQIREYIKVCLGGQSNQSMKVYGGKALNSSTLPRVVFVTEHPSTKRDDCGLLIADAIGMDADTVELTFQMWSSGANTPKIQLTGNDMFSRRNIMQQMQLNRTVSDNLLKIVNNGRFWKQSGYKSTNAGAEMITYILFTRYMFEVDSSGGNVPLLKNENNQGQVQILENKNVIIFAIDLLKYFNVRPFDVETQQVTLKSTSPPYTYEVVPLA